MSGMQGRERWMVFALWLPGVLVALGAAAATAHGLFEVALGSGVPAGIAWIYPLITDGLAIVAYVATAQLAEGGRRYAWTVVILAAGLSGIAQATYLAGGVAAAATGVAAPAAPPDSLLRFGVGAWPAIAAAIVAHLLFMLAAEHGSDVPSDAVPVASGVEVSSTRVVGPSVAQASAVQPGAVQRQSVQPGLSGESVQPSSAVQQPSASDASGDAPATVQSAEASEPASVEPASPESPRRTPVASSPLKDRARAAARRHAAHQGDLPTVDTLMYLADVSRGTAGTALKELREQPAPLHVITENTIPRTQS
ncbi:DUF2637 domain-containing protein [Amycolatopsis sp. H20-H5]|uniref:DUF2637 domain-containing protein n=1 Tax=Amycolatopsis sp. H20-H5 TaxID=3046309 RepID=UPI002DB9F6DB|nr:DUF2637 domain-containing protein [Amycolatopsis sp. H20-H5]MEC3976243.1 DUF2637 domain-containing protein [Amycolatopsis sp. H20-H5]